MSNVNGITTGETLAKYRPSDFEPTKHGKESEATQMLLKAVKTSCQAIGHTPEAAKHARKKLCYEQLLWAHYNLPHCNTR